MLKTKYDRMTKDEKKELLKQYKKMDAGKSMVYRLTRLKIIGIIGLILAISLVVFQIKDIEMTDFLTIVPLFLASILFIMMSYKLKRKVLNQFAIKKL